VGVGRVHVCEDFSDTVVVKLDFLADEVLLFNEILSEDVLLQGFSSHTLRGPVEGLFATAFFALSEGHFDKLDVNRDKLG